MSAAEDISPPVCLKEEPEWDNASDSELNPEHEVKSELEWSPERIQPQDIVYKIPESSKKIKIEIDIVTQDEVERELEIHPRKKEFHCFSTKYETCKKTFYSANSLAKHILTHSNVCGVCNKTFANKHILARHKTTHSYRKKQFACKICQKRFYNNFVLSLHKATHKGKKSKVEKYK